MCANAGNFGRDLLDLGGLHLIVLRLSCSTACQLRPAPALWCERSAVQSSQAVEQPSQSAIRCSPSLTKRAPAGRTGGFWVLEQHVPRPLCACAKVLPHVAAFSVIMSRAPPVFVLRCTPGASQATVQPEARARIIAWISWLTGRGQQSDSYMLDVVSSREKGAPPTQCVKFPWTW